MKTSAPVILGVIALSIAACTSMPMSGSSSAPDIVMEEFMVPSGDPGIELYVRNKHPAGMTSVAGSKIVLYVHGPTYPSDTAFDPELYGLSWLGYTTRPRYE